MAGHESDIRGRERPSRSAVAATEVCLDNIRRHGEAVNAFITVTEAPALEQAAAADRAAGAGRWLGLCHGLPVAIKDNIETAGVRTTSGARFFADHVPNADAPVVARLKAAGAVVVGKASLQEFAFGVRNHNPISGQCANPWDLTRIPGGSSGGSGAAVASEMCAAALGSDTGGSIRCPASFNGVAGLRPTPGRVSNRGSTPVSRAHDTIGPLARRVADVARLFAVIAGYDPADPNSVDRPLENFLPGLGDGVAGLRIGVPRHFYFDDLPGSIEEAVRAAIAELASLGAELVEVDLPGVAETHQAMSTLIFADACAFHGARLAEAPELFTEPVYERMRNGLAVTGVQYAKALRFKEDWKRVVRELFATIDILATPTVPIETPLIEQTGNLLSATRNATRNTFAGALADLPGLSLPCGFTAAGMPIGLQLEAAWWREPVLLRAGHAYQLATDWHLARPPLLAGTPD